jgi:dihydrofolate reductase
MKLVSLIAALDRNRAIGFDNRLPWHLPDDLKRFKAMTSGKTVLMGRKTAQSLGRALPNRQNLVLSRSNEAPFDGMQVVNDWSEALVAATSDEVMVIGGGEIYALALPMAQRMYLTEVDVALQQADAFFPVYESDQWQKVAIEPHPADDRHAFAFRYIEYRRRP